MSESQPSAGEISQAKPGGFQFSLRTMLIGVSVLCLLLAVTLPMVMAAREAAYITECKYNLKQIGLALANHQDQKRSMPPAYLVDANGKPAHSWRVLIVPFLEQSDFYDVYTLEESWDGPSNRRLVLGQPVPYTNFRSGTREVGFPPFRCFVCPHCGDRRRDRHTNYVVVVGPETAFPGAMAIQLTDIPDGAENTILVVEIENSDIHWLEPRDLEFDRMSFKINHKSQPSIGSRHPSGPAVVFADGTVARISKSMPPNTLRALLTRNGGEKVDRQQLVDEGLLQLLF